MSIYSTMSDSLKATGIYDPEKNLPLYSELMAYGDALNEVSQQADILATEAFLATARDYGISSIEGLYGKVLNGISIDERRSIILNRLCINPGDFTIENIKKVLVSCGLTYHKVYEDKENELLTITGGGHKYSESQVVFILSQLPRLLPAHLEYRIYLNEIIWSSIERRELTWAEMESYDYTWQIIDELEENN